MLNSCDKGLLTLRQHGNKKHADFIAISVYYSSQRELTFINYKNNYAEYIKHLLRSAAKTNKTEIKSGFGNINLIQFS